MHRITRGMMLVPLFLLQTSSFALWVISSENNSLAPWIETVLFSSQSASIAAYSITDPEVVHFLPTIEASILAEKADVKAYKRDPYENLFHAKLLVTPKYALFGSMNFTHSSLHEDLNDAIVFNEKDMIQALAALFHTLWDFQGKSIYKTRYGVFYVGPFQNLEEVVMRLLSKARKEVKIAVYAFTDKNILGALKFLTSLGVEVKIAIDDWNKNFLLREKLEQFQVKVFSKTTLHHKFLIVDDMWLLTGSANFTESGFHKNFELIFVTNNKEIVKSYLEIFETIWNWR